MAEVTVTLYHAADQTMSKVRFISGTIPERNIPKLTFI